MANDTIQEIDDALDAISAAAGKSKKKGKEKGSHNLVVRVLLSAVKFVLLLTLPFLLLIRTSVFLYLNFGWNSWLAIGGAIVVTSLVLMVYVAFVTGRFGTRRMFSVNSARFSAAVVLVYCIYTLVYISGANTKTDDVRATYNSLHPIMRIGVASIILVDNDLMITDGRRTREDYARMGLPARESSYHFVQDDGFVHAMDIRTVGVQEWQNVLLAGYFRLAGFQTLRHVGTGDHLHVSLRVR